MSLSQALREGSRDEHQRAESSRFVGDLMAGRVARRDYAAYLRRLREVYAALEEVPSRIPDDPFVALVLDAAKQVYELPPLVWPMTGGSGPNHAFIEHLGVPVATLGAGYPGARAHAPDENIRVEDFVRGIKHMARVLVAFGD